MSTPPRSSPDSEPYWAGCRRGELLYQQCTACNEVVFHARAVCPYCLASALEWRRSAGRGEVYSFAHQHIALHADRPSPGPRTLGIAALAEGFHMFTEFLADDPAGIRVGDAINVFFEAQDASGPDGGVVLPKFRVAGR